MSLTEDYQIEWPSLGLKVGCNTNFIIRVPEVSGLIGSPPVSANDQELVGLDGAIGGTESYQTRVVSIPIRVHDLDPATARETLQPLLDAYVLLRSGETAMDVRMPGSPETVMRYYGRPREISESNIRRALGLLEVDLVFDALDPLSYGDETSMSQDTSSPIVVANDGSMETNRVILRVNGNGGTPIITNTSDTYNGDITWLDTLSSDRLIDLHEMRVTSLGGNDVTDETAVSSLWFNLAPGNNTITFSGCASVGVTEMRPAWQA